MKFLPKFTVDHLHYPTGTPEASSTTPTQERNFSSESFYPNHPEENPILITELIRKINLEFSRKKGKGDVMRDLILKLIQKKLGEN